MRGWWNRILSSVFDLSIQLYRTSLSPGWISQRLVNGCGYLVFLYFGGEGVHILFVWLAYVVLRTSLLRLKCRLVDIRDRRRFWFWDYRNCVGRQHCGDKLSDPFILYITKDPFQHPM